MENRIGRDILHRQLNRRLGEKLHGILEYLGYAATPDLRMLVSDGTLMLDPNADDLHATYVDSRLKYDNGSLDGSLVYKIHDGNVLSLRRKPDGTWATVTASGERQDYPINDRDIIEQIEYSLPRFDTDYDARASDELDGTDASTYRALGALLTRGAEGWGDKRLYRQTIYKSETTDGLPTEGYTEVAYIESPTDRIFEYCYVETVSMEGDAIVTRRFTSTHDMSKNYLWITRTPLDTCETVVVHDRKSHDYRAVESAIDALCDEKRLLTMATS